MPDTYTIAMAAALGRLDETQRSAVTHTSGPMLVIAGAGSGKTSVLTARVALLISQGVRPERILALTFTRKAAEEMRSRIIALQGDAAKGVVMGTFHSVLIRLLRPHAERIGFPREFTILDEDDSLATIKRCVARVVGGNRPPKETWTESQAKSYREEDSMYKPKLVASIISSCKNDLVTADDYASDAERRARDARAGRGKMWKIFLEYRNECHRMAMMDFDDILLHTDILLSNYPDVLAMTAGAYDHILVDEYQDTNTAQCEILRKLTLTNKNICAVGDDSQSIYAFRGARIQNILRFADDYPGCVTVKLERNYRSSQNIVKAANNLIAKNANRIPKECFSGPERGLPISLRTNSDERSEARGVADAIRSLSAEEGRPLGDFAVLYRTNAQSRALEDAMVRARIPYVVYSGTSFFGRTEVKDLMAYYKLAVNPRDNESFARVVNKPGRRFGDAALRLLYESAMTWGVSLWDAAMDPRLPGRGLSVKALEGLANFTANILECADLAASKGAYAAASKICERTGFHEAYLREGDEESLDRAENIRELVDSVRVYEEECRDESEGTGVTGDPPTLEGYLQNALLLSAADSSRGDDDRVSLMTVHCAKGLEFDTVFVTGMERGLFPLEIDGDDHEEEEERRLFYVAMTRAKRRLVLTRAEKRMRFGKRQNTEPSGFLTEILSREARAKEGKQRRKPHERYREKGHEITREAAGGE